MAGPKKNVGSVSFKLEDIHDSASRIELVKIVQCSNCLEIPIRPIFTCENGHVICSSCRNFNPRCGFCMGPVTNTRNRVAENVVKSFVFKCLYRSEGCSAYIRWSEIMNHLSDCEFRPVPCSESLRESCWGKMIPYSVFLTHLNDCHNIRKIRAVENLETSRSVYCNSFSQNCSWPLYSIGLDNCVFMQHLILENSVLYMWVSKFGDELKSVKYAATIILKKGVCEIKISIPVQSFRKPLEEIKKSGLYLALQKDQLMALSQDNARDDVTAPQLLAVSAWDGFMRIYDVKKQECVFVSEENHPLLCCATTSHRLYYGGLDCTVYCLDLETQLRTDIGEHMNAVRCMEHSQNERVLVTGSWDASIRIWDSRNSSYVGTLPQVNEVFCMDVRDELVVVGTANKVISVWDLRNTKSFISEAKSELRSQQIRSIKIFPDKKKFAVGSVEGRIAIDPILKNRTDSAGCIFKAHVNVQEQIGHPVNALSVCSPTSLFVSGASDKKVYLWDGERQKRTLDVGNFPSSIAAMDFSHDGSMLAIGCSYTHDLVTPPDPLPPNRIYINPVTFFDKLTPSNNLSLANGFSFILEAQNLHIENK
ncbi:unnamed protein product [Allacma fusca]|uniref:RING-type E3 ubiquitin transferase n=1 Tax=Allacma fusca TaxID=39272 RepID=A0A8J2P3H4_9HEXA|nr:unnamed protein product [Allacma fusca]